MDEIVIVFPVSKLIYSNDFKKVNESVLCFPAVLHSVVDQALINKTKKIDQEALAHYNINMKIVDDLILIEKDLTAKKDADVYINRVYIEIPTGFTSYLNVKIIVSHSSRLKRVDVFNFINDISTSDNAFIKFTKDREFNTFKKMDRNFKLSSKKLLATLNGEKNLQLRYFTQDEIYINEEASLKIIYSESTGLLVCVYESKENEHSIYEDENIGIDKIIFIKKIERGSSRNQKYRVSMARILYKFKNSKNGIIMSHNQKPNGTPITKCDNYKLFVNEFYGSVIFNFKEGGLKPKLDGCCFSEDFDNCGLGSINLTGSSVEGRVILSSKHSEDVNLILVFLVRKMGIDKKELLFFIRNLDNDLSEDELLNILEINFISGEIDINVSFEILKRLNFFYKKVWDILRDGDDIELIIQDILEIKKDI